MSCACPDKVNGPPIEDYTHHVRITLGRREKQITAAAPKRIPSSRPPVGALPATHRPGKARGCPKPASGVESSDQATWPGRAARSAFLPRGFLCQGDQVMADFVALRSQDLEARRLGPGVDLFGRTGDHAKRLSVKVEEYLLHHLEVHVPPMWVGTMGTLTRRLSVITPGLKRPILPLRVLVPSGNMIRLRPASSFLAQSLIPPPLVPLRSIGMPLAIRRATSDRNQFRKK